MPRMLQTEQAAAIADSILINLTEELGYLAEEALPGLVVAIYRLAKRTDDTEQALNEVFTLLEDGDPEDELGFATVPGGDDAPEQVLNER